MWDLHVGFSGPVNCASGSAESVPPLGIFFFLGGGGVRMQVASFPGIFFSPRHALVFKGMKHGLDQERTPLLLAARVFPVACATLSFLVVLACISQPQVCFLSGKKGKKRRKVG